MNADRVKHLEMIQAVITRLGNDSFLIKGWAVTVTGVLLGFAVNTQQQDLAWIAVFVVACFWGLDAYYLHAERLFRVLFSRARDSEVELFVMDATSPTAMAHPDAVDQVGSIWKTAGRPTLWVLYSALIVAATVTFLIVGAQPHQPQSSDRASESGAKVSREAP